MDSVKRCANCIFRVRCKRGIYCVLHGIWVGESDVCSSFWGADDWLSFVRGD